MESTVTGAGEASSPHCATTVPRAAAEALPAASVATTSMVYVPAVTRAPPAFLPFHPTRVTLPPAGHLAVLGTFRTSRLAASSIRISAGHEPERASAVRKPIVVVVPSGNGFGAAATALTVGPVVSSVIVSAYALETLPAPSR